MIIRTSDAEPIRSWKDGLDDATIQAIEDEHDALLDERELAYEEIMELRHSSSLRAGREKI